MIDMDGYLFDIEEYTMEQVREKMSGRTCRQCANRKSRKRDLMADPKNLVYYCAVRDSKRSNTGKLPVRANQPACILFTVKDPTK